MLVKMYLGSIGILLNSSCMLGRVQQSIW